MTGNLIPESRVNVLGHVVVKHVRAEDSSSQRKANGIPAPSARDTIDAPFLKKSLKRVPFAKATPKDFDPESVVRVEALLKWVEEEYSSSRWRVDDEIRRMLKLFEDGKKAQGRTVFNNMAVFGEVIVKDMNNELGSYIKGLKKYPEFAGMKDFFTESTPERREQAEALVRFASAFGMGPSSEEFLDFGRDDPEDYGFPYAVHVKDLEMRSLIMDHPKRVDEITRIIGRDYITDAKHLREIIEHDQQALSDGIL